MVLPLEHPTKSYWIEAAKSDLRNYRSTPELPEEVDVVIIGSGYTGATTAYWLDKFTEDSEVKPQLLILEARDVCGGATGRNGGQLRPHAYSRYPAWAARFGPDGALSLIEHEMAHLVAFEELLRGEGILEEVCFQTGETFDAAMSNKAWVRLKGAFEQMQRDHGKDGSVIRDCRLIEDPSVAEEFTQMKGCVGAVVHPSGQIWPYKFVHALLRIVMQKGHLNVQANTPALEISKRDAEGWITVKTARGSIKTKSVVHATNRWASHLLPDFENLIHPSRGTLAAIKAPPGFIKHTGAQHWDHVVNNYHLQLPPPYNTIILGGGKRVLTHDPTSYILNDSEDEQFTGIPGYFQSWAGTDVVNWPVEVTPELALETNQGGCWTGIMSSSIDDFPFVGAVPDHDGHFMAAGFTGHGMPRILLSTAYIAPMILTSLDIKGTEPALVKTYPSLPNPFRLTPERMRNLQETADPKAKYDNAIRSSLQSAKEGFCTTAGQTTVVEVG